MENKDMPAMPTSPNANDPQWSAARTGGLTKREQAAISILSGLVANQLNCNDTDKNLAYRASALTEALFDELEG